MKNRFVIIALLTALPAFAQHNPHQHAPTSSQEKQGHSIYAGMRSHVIKALSKKQINDLRAGKGMSLALPAELNGYPGPAHVVELAEPLGLSAEQKLKTQTLFESMQSQAKVLGEQVISAEYKLDRLFKDGRASDASIEEATAKAAQLQGQLRAFHLRYHLNMMKILTSAQVAKYSQLRGY
jgi:Spy/CpxP family protein refolding chaperone